MKNRSIDALRIEYRLYKKSIKASLEDDGRVEKLFAALRGSDLEVSAILENGINGTIIKELLEGNQTWREIASRVNLKTADAARKRFDRYVQRLASRGK